MALEYFPCFYSYRKKIAKLSDQEVGRLFRRLLEYGETGECEELTGREAVAFDFIADDIDRAKEQYQGKCEANRRNVAKRYERIRTNTDVENEYEPYQTETETETETEIKEKNKKEKRKVFVPPTVEEVEAYCRERANRIDAQSFVDWYTAKDWKIGKVKMVDWKAAVRTWERKNGDKPQQNSSKWNITYDN